MELLVGVVAVLGIGLISGLLAERLAEQRDRRLFPPPGQMVTAGRRRIHLVCGGERRPGRPVVVLETGMGSWSFYWRLVLPAVAQFARVCAYDRPGFGWSDPGERPRSAGRIATELHQALQAAGEPGPYLLVGHSLGGIFIRQFARLYPDEVVGMVLVDSAHEDQIERMPWARKETDNLLAFFNLLAALHRLGILRLLGKPLLARFTSVRTPEERRLFLAMLLASRYFDTGRDESRCFLDGLPAENRLASLGSKPLLVIQAGGQPAQLPRGYSPERWQAQRLAWDAIQQDLLRLSENNCLVIAQNSIHTVQVEEPEVVIEAIRDVFNRL